jgi:hypothetical protein
MFNSSTPIMLEKNERERIAGHFGSNPIQAGNFTLIA